jgi:hypothetical protein
MALWNDIMDEVWDFLEDVSDECGETELGYGYLLKYEGWSGNCVDDEWKEVEKRQRMAGKDTETKESEQEKTEACCEYAGDQTLKIIQTEWRPRLRQRGYSFVDGGYEHGGLYGKTWALFRKRHPRKKKKA